MNNRIVTSKDILLVLALTFFFRCLFDANFIPRISNMGIVEMVFPTAFLVFCLAAWLLKRKASMSIASTFILVVSSGLIGSVGYLFSAAFLGADSAALAFIGALLGSAFLAFAGVAFVNVVSAQGRTKALIIIASSYAICELIQLLFQPLPDQANSCYRLICPLLSSLLILPSLKTRNEVKLQHTGERLPILLLTICLLLICFNDVFSQAIVGASPTGNQNTAPSVPLLSLFLMICALTYLLMQAHVPTVSLLPMFIVLATVYMLSLVLAVLLPSGHAAMADNFMLASGHSFKVFMLAVVCAYTAQGSCRTDDAALLFSIITVLLPNTLQASVGDALSTATTGSNIPRIVTIALFVLAIVLVGFVLHSVPNERRHIAEDQEDWLQRHVTTVTASAGLSPKETEVAIMVYRGHTAAKISEEMNISKSTVNTYINRAYRKLEVHSRQEFIDLVDQQ